MKILMRATFIIPSLTMHTYLAAQNAAFSHKSADDRLISEILSIAIIHRWYAGAIPTLSNFVMKLDQTRDSAQKIIKIVIQLLEKFLFIQKALRFSSKLPVSGSGINGGHTITSIIQVQLSTISSHLTVILQLYFKPKILQSFNFSQLTPWFLHDSQKTSMPHISEN